MSGSRLATQVEEGKAEKMVEGRKQQPIVEPALKPVFDVVELENVMEEEDDQEEREKSIKESEIEKEKIQKKEKEKEKEEGRRKRKSEISREKKRETTLAKGKEVPYPLVPSKKDKE